MEILDSVDPNEVPDVGTKPQGVWTRLAAQVIEAHRQGKVMVIKAKDRTEHKRLINGMSEKLRQAGYSRQFTSVDNADGSVTVYCQLTDLRGTVVVQPIRRPRRRANA